MMPSVALVQIPKVRRLPPFPVLLVPLWPLVWFCLGIAKLLERDRPEDALKLRASIGARGSSQFAMPRSSLLRRLFRKEVIFQRCGYCPVEIATREGEQMGELT